MKTKYELVKVNVYSVSYDNGLTVAKNQKSVPLPYSVGSAYDFGRALVAAELSACFSYADYMHDFYMDKVMDNTTSDSNKIKFQEKADKWFNIVKQCETAMVRENCAGVRFFRTVAYAVAYAIFPICRRRHGKLHTAIDDFAPTAFELAKSGNYKELKSALVAMMNSTTSADKECEWTKGFATKVKQDTVENAVRHAKLVTYNMTGSGINDKQSSFENWTKNVVLAILKDTFHFVPAAEKQNKEGYTMIQ